MTGLMILFLGHMIADFYFQTENIAENKQDSINWMILHCTIYAVIITALVVLLTGRWELIFVVLIIFVTHFLLDEVKLKIEMRKDKPLLFFLLDQVAHLIILYLIWKWFVEGKQVLIIDSLASKLLAYITLILVLVQPGSIVVMKAITNSSEDSEQTDEKRYGRYIGILERLVISILILCGLGATIGFVLTAKTVARFSKMKEQSFSEKYLVGTLLSSLIAIGSTYIAMTVVGKM